MRGFLATSVRPAKTTPDYGGNKFRYLGFLRPSRGPTTNKFRLDLSGHVLFFRLMARRRHKSRLLVWE